MTLRLVHNRTMNEPELARRLEKAMHDLHDARASAISHRRRFQCAYDAAYECALAVAGAMNRPISRGSRHHREAFRKVLGTLSCSQPASLRTERMGDHHYLEDRLFYCGETAANEPVVERAIHWAGQLHAATLERLTHRSGAAQVYYFRHNDRTRNVNKVHLGVWQ